MRRYLEQGGTMQGKVVWVQRPDLDPIEGVVLSPENEPLEDEDYFGKITVRLIQDGGFGETLIDIPHKTAASGGPYWFFKGEE